MFVYGYGGYFVFNLIKALVVVGIIVLCVCLERRNKPRRKNDNINQENKTPTKNNTAVEENPKSVSESVKSNFSDVGAEPSPVTVHAPETEPEPAAKPEPVPERTATQPATKPALAPAPAVQTQANGAMADKGIRIASTVVASLFVLAAFTIVAFAFFQTRSVLYYAVRKIDRYVTSGRAKAYFAISVVCACISAAGVITTFLRWRNICESEAYFVSFIMLSPLLLFSFLFAFFYTSNTVKGVMACEILITVSIIIYVVITFLFPPKKKTKKA